MWLVINISLNVLNLKIMKKILVIALICLQSSFLFAQKAFLAETGSLVPLENFKPDKPCKIVVNLNLTKNEYGIIDKAKTDDMYMWTWSPFEFPLGNAKANGEIDPAWKNSNPLLKMTKEAEGIFSYILIPTEFYEITAQQVYDRDFKLLLKPKDGGGFGAPDFKTEDLIIEVDLPIAVVKLASFPEGLGSKKDTLLFSDGDPFSIIYDHKAEAKPSLDLATEFYIFPKAKGSDGLDYKLAANAKQVINFPQLKMKAGANDIFTGTFIPEQIFSVPSGVKIAEMTLQIVRPNLVNSDDAVDEILTYFFKDSTCD